MVATCVAIVPSSPVSGHGLCVLCDVTPAADAPKSAVAVEQMTELRNRGFRPKTVSGDKGYPTREFAEGTRAQGVVPHPALKAQQKTWRVRLTAAHALSQTLRKRIEEISAGPRPPAACQEPLPRRQSHAF